MFGAGNVNVKEEELPPRGGPQKNFISRNFDAATRRHHQLPPSISKQNKPKSGLECPHYDVLETSGDVELRRYASQRYASTCVKGAATLLEAQVVGTKRLLGYWGGENKDGRRLGAPTVPLETLLFPADAAAETVKGRFVVALLLPRGAQV